MKVGLLLLVPLAMLLAAPWLPLERYVELATHWMQGLGPWGPVAYVGLYAVATVAALPISILAACAGFLFGPAKAMVALVAGAVLGATLSFVLARTVGRTTARRWVAGSPRLARLDEVIAARGPIVVALARVTPGLPFGLMNYAFGLTAVPARTYVGYTFLGVLPGSALNAVGSATLAHMLRTGQVPWISGAVLLALVLLAILLGRHAYRVLQ